MVLVSVIMGIYNGRRRQAARAIDSILEQTLENLEFIICDDGSDEDFYGWLERFCRKDGRIVLLRNGRNLGLAGTLNRCLRHARGKYIARMDGDDISDRRRLERQADVLERNPGYALAGCNVRLVDSRGVWGWRRLGRVPQRRDFLSTSPFVHPAVMIRRNVMDALGGYSEEPVSARTEDYELFMRLYAAGYCGCNLQEFLFCYREDRDAYRRRRYRYRLNECRIRYRGFRELGILKGNIRYVIKPLAAGLVPAGITGAVRRKKYGYGG